MNSIQFLIDKLTIGIGSEEETLRLPITTLTSNEVYGLINVAKEMHKQEMATNCSQQEISDEEIDNAVVKEYENVGDEKLFPNHSDKDIWMNGFYEGAKWYREQLKQKL